MFNYNKIKVIPASWGGKPELGSKIKVIPASRVVKSSWGLFGFDLWFGVALGHVSRSTECLIRGPAGRREPPPIHHKREFRLCKAIF